MRGKVSSAGVVLTSSQGLIDWGPRRFEPIEGATPNRSHRSSNKRRSAKPGNRNHPTPTAPHTQA